jgi:hypothetical protein
MSLSKWLVKPLELMHWLAALVWPAGPLRIKHYQVIDPQADAEMQRVLARRISKACRSERAARSFSGSLCAVAGQSLGVRPCSAALSSARATSKAPEGWRSPKPGKAFAGSWREQYSKWTSFNQQRPWTN